jgi:hypothetical protein
MTLAVAQTRRAIRAAATGATISDGEIGSQWKATWARLDGALVAPEPRHADPPVTEMGAARELVGQTLIAIAACSG